MPRGADRKEPAPTSGVRWAWVAILSAIFLASLLVRIYGAFTVGFGLDGPGSFQMINYDEGGSCEGKLGAMPYPSFIGTQIIAVASLLGYPPPQDLLGRSSPLPPQDLWKGKSYCESPPLIVIQRLYSAVLGALTVVLVGVLALIMWPSRPQIAWTACVLLGLSSFHVAQSHWGTVDIPQVFYLVLFTTALTYAVTSKRIWPLVISPLLLAFVVMTKYYLFAAAAYACYATRWRISKIVPILIAILAVLGASVLLFWNEFPDDFKRRALGAVWGGNQSRFGTGYANIGFWRRWIRNGTNLFTVHFIAFGIPACLFVWNGIRRAIAAREMRPLWLTHAPAAVYTLYMLLLAPVTYYRYYLPLLPTVALLAAYGFWESKWATRKGVVALFLLYPLLLTLDSEYNYRFDPRHELRAWSAAHPAARSFFTFYVVPPKTTGSYKLFNIGQYLGQGADYLKDADYVILSENWYDTSFRNELNGPIAWKPEWLIKTRPEYVVAYRRMLANLDPNLELETELNLKHFTPEYLLHRWFYGSFQIFVGDLKILRVKK